MTRTSETDRIRVGWCLELPNGGAVGMTFAPGKWDDAPNSAGGIWRRDLPTDLDDLGRLHRATLLVSLVEDAELRLLRIERLVPESEARGLPVERFPIPDRHAPSDRAAAAALIEGVVARVQAGGRVVFHCRGGLGRAGTLAACTLITIGYSASEAIAMVRKARGEDAIETEVQERFVADWR